MIKHHTSNDSQLCQSGERLIKQQLTLGKSPQRARTSDK